MAVLFVALLTEIGPAPAVVSFAQSWKARGPLRIRRAVAALMALALTLGPAWAWAQDRSEEQPALLGGFDLGEPFVLSAADATGWDFSFEPTGWDHRDWDPEDFGVEPIVWGPQGFRVEPPNWGHHDSFFEPIAWANTAEPVADTYPYRPMPPWKDVFAFGDWVGLGRDTAFLVGYLVLAVG